jgi:hypothetical protein
MTAAVVALAIVLAGVVGALLYHVSERITAERKAFNADRLRLEEEDRAEDAIELRDRAVADATRRGAELEAERIAHAETAALLTAAQEVIADELRKQIHATPDADLPALAQRMLEERRAVLSARAQAAAAATGDRRAAGDDQLSRPRPAATPNAGGNGRPA